LKKTSGLPETRGVDMACCNDFQEFFGEVSREFRARAIFPRHDL
jgi:hypothetical protein